MDRLSLDWCLEKRHRPGSQRAGRQAGRPGPGRAHCGVVWRERRSFTALIHARVCQSGRKTRRSRRVPQGEMWSEHRLPMSTGNGPKADNYSPTRAASLTPWGVGVPTAGAKGLTDSLCRLNVSASPNFQTSTKFGRKKFSFPHPGRSLSSTPLLLFSTLTHAKTVFPPCFLIDLRR